MATKSPENEWRGLQVIHQEVITITTLQLRKLMREVPESQRLKHMENAE
jgi:hypothetical protein